MGVLPLSFRGLAPMQSAAGTQWPHDPSKKRTLGPKVVQLMGSIPPSTGDLEVLLHAKRSEYLLQTQPGMKAVLHLDPSKLCLYHLADLLRRRVANQLMPTSWTP